MSISAIARAIAAPLSAFLSTMIGRKKARREFTEFDRDALAKAEAKRLRKQQKRVSHAPV